MSVCAGLWTDFYNQAYGCRCINENERNGLEGIQKQMIKTITDIQINCNVGKRD